MSPTDDSAASPEPAYRSRWRRFSPSMGWKAFVSEIFIVVLGVMIALAANEAVESWNWNDKVRTGEDRLRTEMKDIFEWSAEMIVTEPCVKAQLSAATTNLLNSGNTLHPLPTYSSIAGSFVVRHPARPFGIPVWRALEADGTVAHFSAASQYGYSLAAETVARLAELTRDNTRAVGSLMLMSHPIALDAGVRKDLLREIEEQQSRVERMAFLSAQVMQRISEMNRASKAEEVNAHLATSGTVSFCKEHGLPLADWGTYADQS